MHRMGAQVHALGANESICVHMHPLATPLAKISIHSDARLTSLKISVATITDFHLPDMNI